MQNHAKILDGERNYALALIEKYHTGQRDKADKNYNHHLFMVAAVATRLVTQFIEWKPSHLGAVDFEHEVYITALLHDILEDTPCPIESLTKSKSIPFAPSEMALKAIQLLTKQKGQRKEDYFNAIKANPTARLVKIADLLHNLELRRFVIGGKRINRDDILRSQRYLEALAFLIDDDAGLENLTAFNPAMVTPAMSAVSMPRYMIGGQK